MSKKVLDLIKSSEAKFVDLRFTDTKGKEQHVTIPSRDVNAGFFKEGKMFDGSSIAGWKGINESDMILMPDADSAVVDPFYEEATVNIRCDIVEPSTMQGYERDPRSVARRAEEVGAEGRDARLRRRSDDRWPLCEGLVYPTGGFHECRQQNAHLAGRNLRSCSQRDSVHR